MSKRGSSREYAVRDRLREAGWLAFRAPASLGVADVIALKANERPRLIEVKSDARDAYGHFGPDKRDRLRDAARLAGADAFLVHWPPRGVPRWIGEDGWPA